MIQNWKFVWEWHNEFESVSGKEGDEQSEMFEGKLKKFKNWPILCKTRDFRDWNKSRASRQGQLPEHLKENFWKSFLSIFCNWKFHSRESRELSREKHETPIFEKKI